MLRTVLLSAVVVALMSGTFCSGADRPQTASALAASATRETVADLNQRLAIKFCYAQYRGQSDIMRCLAQGV
jgi:hypothetical protein